MVRRYYYHYFLVKTGKPTKHRKETHNGNLGGNHGLGGANDGSGFAAVGICGLLGGDSGLTCGHDVAAVL